MIATQGGLYLLIHCSIAQWAHSGRVFWLNKYTPYTPIGQKTLISPTAMNHWRPYIFASWLIRCCCQYINIYYLLFTTTTCKREIISCLDESIAGLRMRMTALLTIFGHCSINALAIVVQNNWECCVPGSDHYCLSPIVSHVLSTWMTFYFHVQLLDRYY